MRGELTYTIVHKSRIFEHFFSSTYTLQVVVVVIVVVVITHVDSCTRIYEKKVWVLKKSCHIPFTHAVKTVHDVFELLTLLWTNQCNYLEIAMQSRKRMRKRDVQTQLEFEDDVCYKKIDLVTSFHWPLGLLRCTIPFAGSCVRIVSELTFIYVEFAIFGSWWFKERPEEAFWVNVTFLLKLYCIITWTLGIYQKQDAPKVCYKLKIKNGTTRYIFDFTATQIKNQFFSTNLFFFMKIK